VAAVAVTDRVPTTGPTRVVIVTLMGVVIAIVAGGVFDRVLPSLVIPPVTVGVTAFASRRLRRRWRAVALALAASASAVVVARMNDGGLGDTVDAVVRGPRRLLTTEWPSPVEPSIVVAVGLLVAIATATAALVADARRWRFAPVVPLAIATVIVTALGAPEPPAWWAIALLGAGVFAIGALPPGELLGLRVTTLLGDRTVGVTIAGVTILSVLVSSVITSVLPSSGRADPRRVEAAEATSSVLDPIEATVAMRRADPPIELFEITDRSALVGRALPARWRLAALDQYDGQRWVPQVTLRPIGERLGLAPSLEPDDLPPITYEVVYRSDDVDLVPFPGRPLSIDAPVETDLERVAVRLSDPPSPGTTVTATSMVAPSIATVDALGGALFARRPVDEIAQTFAEQARELAGEGDLLQQLRAIETTMRTEWVLDRDASGGGQQLALLERFVTDTRRGTREQFVTAFALFARSLGVDARVATGFVIPPESLTSPVVVESGHAAAWPEVRLDGDPDEVEAGDGWLAFDPVPARQEIVEDDEPTPPDAQSPAAAQPPIEPPADDPPDDEERTVEITADAGRWSTIIAWAVRIGVGASIGLLPLVIVVGTILAAKWWRRRTRLRHPDPVHRVRGAWANVTDALVDAGLTIGPAWTDDRIARGGAPLAPSVPHELRRLAAMATAMTFGARDDAWRLVDDAASTSRTIDAALRAERSRWQRIRWRLSLRSLRPRSRSPVVA
jgi:hypothetical protein